MWKHCYNYGCNCPYQGRTDHSNDADDGRIAPPWLFLSWLSSLASTIHAVGLTVLC
jgi:hypothetical protein